MKDQQEVLSEERLDCVEGVVSVLNLPFYLAIIVMAQVHGINVIRHVGYAKPHKISGQPVSVSHHIFTRFNYEKPSSGGQNCMEGGHQPLANQYNISFGPCFESTGNNFPKKAE